MIGIVGPSGAGKSTLINLILGLHVPTEGRIAVDGQDILSVLPAWRRTIGYVPQRLFMLDDTIRRNVAFGLADTEIDEAKIWNCLRKSRLEEFVRGLPDKLETTIGEDGSRLSGGQRQRLGIARALYRQPAVLVLDEATSALDTQIEEEIGRILSALTGDHTVIVVAHRLGTVQRCDTLIHLREGRLSEVGDYQLLTKASSAFRDLMGQNE